MYLLCVVFVHILVIKCTFVYIEKLSNFADAICIIFEVYIVVIFKMYIC